MKLLLLPCMPSIVLPILPWAITRLVPWFSNVIRFSIFLITKIVTLTRNCQAQIDCHFLCINARCLHHEYAVGQLVYKLNYGHDKLDPIHHGPFPILRIHTNNTVTIQIGPVHKCISIRHLTPVRPS